MILAPEVGGAIDHTHGGRLFHHAHKASIPTRISADGARLIFGEVATFLAGPDALAHGGEDGSEPLSLFRRLLEQMESEPLGRLPAYSREPGKFGDQLLDCAHRFRKAT